MEQVKIFTPSGHPGSPEFEKMMNDWLTKMGEGIQIVRVLQSQSKYYTVISVWYIEDKGFVPC